MMNLKHVTKPHANTQTGEVVPPLPAPETLAHTALPTVPNTLNQWIQRWTPVRLAARLQAATAQESSDE